MNQSAIARIIIVVALILVGGGAIAYSVLGHKTVTVNATVPVATQTSTYKDGTYSATGSYISPGGNEKIGVTVTLRDGVITSASVKPEPVSQEGVQFQSIFQKNFQPLVVGKNIADVHLTTVSGSSLTPGGFDNALAQIEAEAKA